MRKIPMLVIGGPTASGKTALAVQIAGRLGGEIISADSMQVYEHMDIGTAKPSMEERAGIAHHMIDVVPPTAEYNVSAYVEAAAQAALQIHQRGHLPILAGGTGLYINTLIDNIKLSEGSEGDAKLRQHYTKLAAQKGNAYLHEKLSQVDPAAAERLHPNDIKRIIRAIEVFELTGIPQTKHIADSKNFDSPFQTVYIGLTGERALLYSRINSRVDQMIRLGLMEEVESLIAIGCGRQHTSMQAIGYKEILDVFDGLCSITEAIDIVKTMSRRYAKRQLSWLRRDASIKWFDFSASNIVDEVLRYYEQTSGQPTGHFPECGT